MCASEASARHISHPRRAVLHRKGDVPAYYECPVCGFLTADPAFGDGDLTCPACGAEPDGRRLFPTERVRRLDARVRRYHDDGENEIVVILVATFLETILEDVLDPASSLLTVRMSASEEVVLDSQRSVGSASVSALPRAHRRAVRGRRRRARASATSRTDGVSCARSATPSSTTRRSPEPASHSTSSRGRGHGASRPGVPPLRAASTTGSSPRSGRAEPTAMRHHRHEVAAPPRHRESSRASDSVPSSTTSRSGWASTGWVLNSSDGVFVLVRGPPETVDAVPRPRARAKAADVASSRTSSPSRSSPNRSTGFEIRESRAEEGAMTLISPDIATCPECLAEMFATARSQTRTTPSSTARTADLASRSSKTSPTTGPITTMRDFPMCE